MATQDEIRTVRDALGAAVGSEAKHSTTRAHLESLTGLEPDTVREALNTLQRRGQVAFGDSGAYDKPYLTDAGSLEIVADSRSTTEARQREDERATQKRHADAAENLTQATREQAESIANLTRVSRAQAESIEKWRAATERATGRSNLSLGIAVVSALAAVASAIAAWLVSSAPT